MTQAPIKSLGELLRTERERRGLTIDQVSASTKIGIRILLCLESDQYADLPAAPFVRGFVKNYAKFIGLDPHEVLRDHKDFIDQKAKERPNREAGHSGYAFERPEGEQSRKMLWLVMGAMITLGGLVVYVFKPSLKHRHHGHLEKLQTPDASAPVAPSGDTPSVAASPRPSAAPGELDGVPKAEEGFIPPMKPLVLAPPAPKPSASVKPKSIPTPTPTPTSSSSPSPKATPVPTSTPSSDEDTTKQDPLQSGVDYAPDAIKQKVIFRALEDIWVRYQCDDKKVTKFRLRKGRLLVLRGKSLIRFQVSNPDSVTFNWNNQGHKVLAKSKSTVEFKQTATITFPPQGIDMMGDSFPGEKALPSTPGPSESTESNAPQGDL